MATHSTLPGDAVQADDDAMLERLQHAAFGYFSRHWNPANGLGADLAPGLAFEHRRGRLRAVGLPGGGGARLVDA